MCKRTKRNNEINGFIKPDPICNLKEKEMLGKLTKEYEKFIKPGPLTRLTISVKNKISPRIREAAKEKIDFITETEIINQLIQNSGKGLLKLQEIAAKYTINVDSVLCELKKSDETLSDYNQICAIRSYDIEKAVQNKHIFKMLQALVQGAVTGAIGLYGIPFNILLSFFIYFRAVQSIALFYGYNVINDPSELEIASQITVFGLSPNYDEAVKTSVKRLQPLISYFHEDSRPDKFGTTALTGVQLYMGNEIPDLTGTVVFTDLARNEGSQPPVRGVLAYTKPRTDCGLNDFSVIDTDYNFGPQSSYYVSLGTNLDQTRLYLGIYGSMKVADFNQGTVFEIVP